MFVVFHNIFSVLKFYYCSFCIEYCWKNPTQLKMNNVGSNFDDYGIDSYDFKNAYDSEEISKIMINLIHVEWLHPCSH